MKSLDKHTESLMKAILRGIGNSHMEVRDIAEKLGHLVQREPEVTDDFREAMFTLVDRHELDFDYKWKVYKPKKP